MSDGINVLSLFDGMSCGRIALDRAKISVEKYYASELDDLAIRTASSNWPENVNLGDVTKWKEWDIDWSSIDLLLGGSPCQGFSLAGKNLAFEDPRSKLFFVYVDILNHIKTKNPKVNFLLENTAMKPWCRDVITDQLGVTPVMINSNLVSAQNRRRWYWSSLGILQPIDLNISLVDVLDDLNDLPEGVKYKPKSNCLRVGGSGSKLGDRHEWDSPYCILRPRGNNAGGKRAVNGKTPCLTSSAWEYNVEVFDSINKRRFSVDEMCRLQTVPIGYFSGTPKTQASKMLGNGWTVDVIAHILKPLSPT